MKHQAMTTYFTLEFTDTIQDITAGNNLKTERLTVVPQTLLTLPVTETLQWQTIPPILSIIPDPYLQQRTPISPVSITVMHHPRWILAVTITVQTVYKVLGAPYLPQQRKHSIRSHPIPDPLHRRMDFTVRVKKALKIRTIKVSFLKGTVSSFIVMIIMGESSRELVQGRSWSSILSLKVPACKLVLIAPFIGHSTQQIPHKNTRYFVNLLGIYHDKKIYSIQMRNKRLLFVLQ